MSSCLLYRNDYRSRTPAPEDRERARGEPREPSRSCRFESREFDELLSLVLRYCYELMFGAGPDGPPG